MTREKSKQEWTGDDTFLLQFHPEGWTEARRFGAFCQSSCKSGGRHKFRADGRPFQAYQGSYGHLNSFRTLVGLAEQLAPGLVIDKKELEDRGHTAGRNQQALSTVVEVAIKEIYSALECTVNVIHAVYGGRARGFRRSASRFIENKDGTQDSLPPEIRLSSRDEWKEVLELRTQLTHWDIGHASIDDNGRVRYAHFSVKNNGTVFSVEDVFAWLRTLEGRLVEFQERVFGFLNENHMVPGAVQATCGIHRGRFYTRLVDPTEPLTRNSGICQARTWFEKEEGVAPCPLREDCGAYRRAIALEDTSAP